MLRLRGSPTRDGRAAAAARRRALAAAAVGPRGQRTDRDSDLGGQGRQAPSVTPGPGAGGQGH